MSKFAWFDSLPSWLKECPECGKPYGINKIYSRENFGRMYPTCSCVKRAISISVG